MSKISSLKTFFFEKIFTFYKQSSANIDLINLKITVKEKCKCLTDVSAIKIFVDYVISPLVFN